MHGVMEPLILIGGLVFVAMIGIGPIVWISLRHEARKRDLEHAERMRAIEMGIDPWKPRRMLGNFQPAPTSGGAKDDDSPAAFAQKCYAIAGWTPFWGFLFAGIFHQSIPALVVTGLVVAVISGISVLCGTYLAAKPQPSPYGDSTYAKPAAYDPDAFDVAGRRG